MKSKRILVTGGAGFIGTNLCKKLLSEGHYVICLDNYSSGNRLNHNDLIKFEKFSIIEHDVINPIDIEVDEIYNLACPASPVNYQKDPIQTLKTSVIGAINLLNLANKYNATILQASTSEVYGDPLVHPQNEEYWGNVNPVGIRSCYDEGKRCAETFFFDYHRMYKTKIKVVRIFNTYGPYMQENDGRVISNFITQALSNENITIFGDGLQTRSFCYIDDLVDGLIKMMESDLNITGPINLGNPTEMPIIDLANLIISKTQSKSKIINVRLPQDDPKRRKPNINEANSKLSWYPSTDINTGVLKTISYFEKLKS